MINLLLVAVVLLFPLFHHTTSSATLNTRTRALFSGHVYVLLPDLHKSGGPACLHALNSQLNMIGINSYMFNLIPQYTTRHSKPVFDGEMYTSPEMIAAAKPRVMEHLLSTLTPNDIVVVPTHWIDSNYYSAKEMKLIQSTGARTIVYLLGVAYPNDDKVESNNGHGIVVGFFLREITNQFASILPLSHCKF